jgi:hypothetical protein
MTGRIVWASTNRVTLPDEAARAARTPISRETPLVDFIVWLITPEW